MQKNPTRSYVIRTVLFMGGYVAIMVALIFGAFDDIRAPGSYVLALAVTAPVVGQLWAVLSLMRHADEYVAGTVVRPFIVGATLAIAVFTGWGFLTEFAGVAAAPAWLIYPLLWFFYGIATPVVNTSRS
ncbi:hypothetical protein [Parvularcula maris]|uniref:Uncharacterized protein n=1 Tax=Parvularcula maris TaxID=2965077 RepID=A0A9X2L8I2_9PROT|nr:hypothetical protein [Parvularcula maris]MCQ8184132.1 hypothetical protein [Parvularcula maris]